LFVFKREYWFPKSLETNNDPIDASNLEFEKEPENLQKSIHLEHISKVILNLLKKIFLHILSCLIKFRYFQT
jgi:hypothetical protein